jgi:hypothetical protein
MRKVLFGFALLTLAVSACGTGTDGAATALPDDVETAVKEALSAETGAAVDDIEVVEAEEKEWSDACLGLAEEGEMCAQVITPGWEVTLRAGGRRTSSTPMRMAARCA